LQFGVRDTVHAAHWPDTDGSYVAAEKALRYLCPLAKNLHHAGAVNLRSYFDNLPDGVLDS
jgi:hypothetical protein